MPRFGRTSNRRLDTCHLSLGLLFREVVKVFDCSVLEGLRTDARQAQLWAQGRTEPGNIVTYCDGVRKKSNHQAKEPGDLSLAIDIAPYYAEPPHIRWDDDTRFYRFAGTVETLARVMDIDLTWGGDFRRLKDLPHWELICGRP